MSTATVVGSAISGILELLPDETCRKVADAALDICENAIEKSENKIDDAILLPAIAKLRSVCNIPDNDTADTAGESSSEV